MELVPLSPFDNYDSFVFSDINNNQLWALNGLFSGDLIAGLIVGMRILANNIKEKGEYLDYVIYIVKKKFAIPIYIAMFQNNSELALREYIYAYQIKSDLINNFYVGNDYYGWWIRDSLDNIYTLYNFLTVEFIQGFISICNAIQIDFRDYIAGPPFQTDPVSGDNIPYNIEGYDIDLFNQPMRIPSPVEPFYTGPDYHGTQGNIREIDGDNDFE